MKLFYIILIFLLCNCSFDNKTGIWKNENNPSKNKDQSVFKDFEKITFVNEIFNKTIQLKRNFKFNLDEPVTSDYWKDYFYGKNNNTENFKYSDLNKIIFKSKKLTRNKTNNYLLFEKNNLIVSDLKGNIIVYSINNKSIIAKFNFYKKKYKKINKILSLIVENNVIYITDNIGYIYAYNYNKNQILWAKNYKKPFRSNLKLHNNKIIASNQNNDLLILEKLNGNLVKLIPSEETVIKNLFINNLCLSKNQILFLNTYGSLYSINKDDYELNWFLNLNKSSNLNYTNLFYGSEIVSHDSKIFISSNENFYIIDSKTGFIITKKNFSLISRPVINRKNVFLISKNNFLISMDINSGRINYSYDIGRKIANFINSKKNEIKIKTLLIVNNGIFIFLKNSYVIKLNIKGEIKELIKLPSKLQSHPIFIDNYLLYLDKRNKLFLIN